MARQTIKSRRNEHATSPVAQRQSSAVEHVGLNYVPNHKGISSAQKRVRDTTTIKDTRKPPKAKYVSAASIFKKTSKVGSREKRVYKHRERTPEPDLILDLQGMKAPNSDAAAF
jgi:hypothetical protein